MTDDPQKILYSRSGYRVRALATRCVWWHDNSLTTKQWLLPHRKSVMPPLWISSLTHTWAKLELSRIKLLCTWHTFSLTFFLPPLPPSVVTNGQHMPQNCYQHISQMVSFHGLCLPSLPQTFGRRRPAAWHLKPSHRQRSRPQCSPRAPCHLTSWVMFPVSLSLTLQFPMSFSASYPVLAQKRLGAATETITLKTSVT